MKFFDAWHDIAKQNRFYKIAIYIHTTFTMCLFFSLLSLVEKPPIIIERGCETITIDSGPDKHTSEEVHNFLTKSLSARFDSKPVKNQTEMSPTESAKRKAEIASLDGKGIHQMLIIRDLKVDKGSAFVKADRILSYKKVRAATAIEMQIKFVKVRRTLENPYGLILSSTEILEQINDKD